MGKKKVPASPGAARRKTEKPLRLEVGGVYRASNGETTQPLVRGAGNSFVSEISGDSKECWGAWNADGSRWSSGRHTLTYENFGHRLIREVKAPKKARK